MNKTGTSSGSYFDQPCERCGSKKRVSKAWKEELATSLGTSIIEVSQITCSNKVCQALYDKYLAEELMKINERKINKEKQDKIRKANIAKTIKARRSSP